MFIFKSRFPTVFQVWLSLYNVNHKLLQNGMMLGRKLYVPYVESRPSSRMRDGINIIATISY